LAKFRYPPLFFVLLLCAPIYSFAMYPESCLDEIGRRLIIIKNQKKICGFKGDIDSKIENLYGSSGCLGKVSKEDYEKAESEISSAMDNEFAQGGKKSFCKEASDYFYKDSRNFYDATSRKLFKDTKQSAKTGVYSKSECIKVLEAGIYNGLLEDYICNFHGGVKERILNVYDKNGCRVLVPQATVDKKVAEVGKDTERRRKAMGTNAFCEGNIDAYNALQPE